MLRSTTLAAAVVAGCLATGAAHAADEYNVSRGVTTDGFPLGLHGVDPVSFLEIGNRIDGTSAYAASHDGVTYYFASEATMKSFQREITLPAFPRGFHLVTQLIAREMPESAQVRA